MICPGCGQSVDVDESKGDVKTEKPAAGKGPVTISQGGTVLHRCETPSPEGASSSGH